MKQLQQQLFNIRGTEVSKEEWMGVSAIKKEKRCLGVYTQLK